MPAIVGIEFDENGCVTRKDENDEEVIWNATMMRFGCGGRHIAADVWTNENGEVVKIEITHDGVGVPADLVERLIDRLYWEFGGTFREYGCPCLGEVDIEPVVNGTFYHRDADRVLRKLRARVHPYLCS